MAVRADASTGIRNIGNTTAAQTPAQIAAGYARSYMPTATPAPAPAQTLPDEPTYYGSAAPAPAPAYSDAQAAQDALNTPEYVMAQQQLANALGLFKSQQASDRQRYDVNYEQALRNLGWIPEATDINGMASKGKWDMGELLTSQGLETASGKSFKNNLNDFAARGLSQSGMFAVAQKAIENRLQQQLAGAEKSRATYGEDQQRKQDQFFMEQQAQRQQALDSAKQNLLNQYMGQSGLGG